MGFCFVNRWCNNCLIQILYKSEMALWVVGHEAWNKVKGHTAAAHPWFFAQFMDVGTECDTHLSPARRHIPAKVSSAVYQPRSGPSRRSLNAPCSQILHWCAQRKHWLKCESLESRLSASDALKVLTLISGSVTVTQRSSCSKKKKQHSQMHFEWHL